MSNMHVTPKTPKKKRRLKRAVRYFLRTLLVIFTTAVLLVIGLCLVCNLIFNGPSETARNVLTMSMLESSGMKWFPAIFIGEDTVNEIQSSVSVTLPNDVSNSEQIVINPGNNVANEEWKDHPDGIRMEYVKGDTYNA